MKNEKMNHSQILTLEPIQRRKKDAIIGLIPLDNWVSIKVTNNHLEDIVECFGHLEINGEPVTLNWHINPPNGLETIRGNTSSLLNIARTKIEKTDGFCVTGQEGDFPTFPQGEYHIRISVGGKINSSKIIPAVFLGQLICKKTP